MTVSATPSVGRGGGRGYIKKYANKFDFNKIQ